MFVAAERGLISWDGLTVGSGEEGAALAAITASELLVGVHRANTAERRLKRDEIVAGVLSRFRVIAFDLDVARVYAAVLADLQARGITVAAHDLQIAATALTRNYDVLTHKLRDFRRIPGLIVYTLDEM